MGDNASRAVAAKSGGKTGDVVSYADEAPILLISEASLQDLNDKLKMPVSMQHFRPNLVVYGSHAFAEDQWKLIRIGEVELEIVQQCKRCIFTTINPVTQQKEANGEPLKTLATYRKLPKGGVGFGVHLIPRKLGKVKIGDQVEVIA